MGKRNDGLRCVHIQIYGMAVRQCSGLKKPSPWILQIYRLAMRPQRGHRSVTEGTSAASTPGQRAVVRGCTLEGCPSVLDIPLIILHAALLKQGNQLVTDRELTVVLFLVDDILHNPLLVCLGVCQGAVTLLPFHKRREAVAVGRHEVVGGNFEVVDKRGHGDGGMQRNKQVYVVGHSVDAVEHALVVLAETKDIHIEVALMFLGDGSRTLISAEDDVVDKLSVGHNALWMVRIV